MLELIRGEFVLFALTLLGVALFHRYTMYIALAGLVSVLCFKWFTLPEFSFLHHFLGSSGHEGEWRVLLNLLGLLFGFAILAKQFELTHLPEKIPHYLPHGKWGAFLLLVMIFVMSSFLDNIAAAMIGGTIAAVVFRHKIHVGYLAAIVAASNAGGSGSVLGDTTTTLMWIDGVSPWDVLHAYVAAFAAFLFFGIVASYQQNKHHPMAKDALTKKSLDYVRLSIVALILVSTILTNWLLDFPALGVWLAIFVGAFFRKTPWEELGKAWQGTVFLISLVLCASLMPVETLPAASATTTFGLGFISAVFDNIPLTKLCLVQGGYDWGMLAYAVGFGGSMIWFGSSAGVALSNAFPEAKNTLSYLKHGWHVVVAYIIGFALLMGTLGWAPHAPHKKISGETSPSQTRNP